MSWFLLGVSVTFNIIAFAIYKTTFDRLKVEVNKFKEENKLNKEND